MARLEPVGGFGWGGDALDRIEQLVGYRPNALATMARVPGMLEGVLALVHAVVRAPGTVPEGLKWLVAFAVSSAAGCPYSACHAAHGGEHLGETLDRVRGVLSDPGGPLFTAAERSALDLARAIGRQDVEEGQVADVRAHHGEAGLAEIVAVGALFGIFNRWNSTLATDLEPEPALFAMEHLAGAGWRPGAHKLPDGPVTTG